MRRILLLSAEAARTDEPAVFKFHNRWIRDGAQALGVHPADHPRLQLQKIGGAEQILLLSQTSGQRQLMTELRRIRGDAVIARDESKGRKPRVEPLCALPCARLYRCVAYRGAPVPHGGLTKGARIWVRPPGCSACFGSDHRCFLVEQISTVESHCS